MKRLACLLLMALPAYGVAQQSPANEANPGNVFVLTVDDAMIDALKKGMSLESQVPAEARGKFTIIRIQYKAPAAAPANANSILRNETTQAPPPTGVNAAPIGLQPPPLGTSSSGPSAWGNTPPNTPGSVTPATPFNLGLPPSGANPAAPNSQTQLTPPPLRLDQAAAAGAVAVAGRDSITLPNGMGAQPWFGPARSNPPSSTTGTSPFAAGAPATATNPNTGFPQRTELSNLGSPPTLPGFAPAGLPPQATTPSDYRNEMVSATALEMQRSINDDWNRGNVTLPPPPAMSTAPASGNAIAADRSPSDSVGRLPIPTSEAEKTLLTKVTSLETANKTLEIQRKESTKWLLFLFLFLMCSLGANIYLGWIARGFYTRFHEMANELRDTFTSAAA